MSNGIREIPRSFILAAALAAMLPVQAQSTMTPPSKGEVRLLSAASMQTVFGEIIGDFERRSGYRVSLRSSTMGAITERIAQGETADLVISSPGSISQLVLRGRIDPASTVSIARTGVGMVVPAGDRAPRMSTVDDFRQALLDARVVVYANPSGGGAAGIHIAKVIDKLGIAEALRPKTKYGAGGDVAEVTIAQGPGAVGLTQVSEIVGKPGMQFIAVPQALQNYTAFVAGTPRGEQPSQAVRAFIAYLRTPEAIAVMKAKGMLVDAPLASTDASEDVALLRTVHDPKRNQTWVLKHDGVYLHDAGTQALKARVELPGWIYARPEYACAPDVALDAQGAAVISSNAVPTLWRIDPVTHAVSVHQPVLDADSDRDFGFSGLVYASDQGAFFATAPSHGSLWRIDPLLRRAQKIPLSAPVTGACGLAVERTRVRRTLVLCATAEEDSFSVRLAPDQRSGYVSADRCRQDNGL